MSTTEPRALPASIWLGLLGALVVVALGVVLGQDALAQWGVTAVGSSWLAGLVEATDGLRAASWTLPAGIAAVVVGLLVLVVTLKPRRRTHVRLDAQTDLWVSPAALAALARDAVEGVPGVADASVTGSRKAVRVRVHSDEPDSVTTPAREAVEARLAGAPVSVSVSGHRSRGGEDQ